MKARTTLLLLIFLLGANLLSSAQKADTLYRSMRDTAAFKVQLKAFNASFRSMECNFTQWKKMKMLKKPALSKGNFAFRNGNEIRWEYTEPFRYTIVIRDQQITIRDQEKSSQYDMSSNKNLLQMNVRMTKLVDGSFLDDHADFRTSYFENGHFYRVQLTPVSKAFKSWFSSITLTFDRKDCSIVSLRMSEKGGDTTELRFTEKKINKPISDERFTIK